MVNRCFRGLSNPESFAGLARKTAVFALGRSPHFHLSNCSTYILSVGTAAAINPLAPRLGRALGQTFRQAAPGRATLAGLEGENTDAERTSERTVTPGRAWARTRRGRQ